MSTAPHPRLVLASTSPYRRALLARLGLAFSTCAPEVDETPAPGEAPEAMARRLAEAKARTVGRRFPDALIIGADQVAVFEGRVLGKPGTRPVAARQLQGFSGKTVTFLSALCLFNPGSGRLHLEVVRTLARFRPLDAGTIDRYLDSEPAFDCVGAFKSEGLGITLLEGLEGEDPNALVGLPLIALVRMLAGEGVRLP